MDAETAHLFRPALFEQSNFVSCKDKRLDED